MPALIGVARSCRIARPGKDGDVALFDGDPFEYTTHVTGVVVNGKVMDGEEQ